MSATLLVSESFPGSGVAAFCFRVGAVMGPGWLSPYLETIPVSPHWPLTSDPCKIVGSLCDWQQLLLLQTRQQGYCGGVQLTLIYCKYAAALPLRHLQQTSLHDRWHNCWIALFSAVAEQQFVFEKWEVAAESSSDMLSYKVICWDSIPERFNASDVQVVARQNTDELFHHCRVSVYRGKRRGWAKQRSGNNPDEIIKKKRSEQCFNTCSDVQSLSLHVTEDPRSKWRERVAIMRSMK